MRPYQPRVRGRYDAAQTTTTNELHWQHSDNLDPHSSNTLEVRKKLRNRSRYECIQNNGYLKGMILNIANDFVGTGPKLQITDRRFNERQLLAIMTRWNEWIGVIKLRRKLWRMRVAKIVDGETFGLKVNNPRQRYPIKLDLKLIEADQVTSLTVGTLPSQGGAVNEVDGVRFDKFDNPLSYHVLSVHPGSQQVINLFPNIFGGEWIDSQHVIHWFRQDRGWMRGVPEVTPSLELCAYLRRYVLAVVQSAEIAAGFSAVMKTQGPPNITAYGDTSQMSQDEIEDNYFDTFPVMRGMITTLPFNSELEQLKAEQPTSMHDKFIDAMLREIARPILVPFNMASGFSGGYNFASGTLDKQLYWGGQKAERLDCNSEVLDDLFDSWWFEASRIPNFFGFGISDQDISGEVITPKHSWGWDEEPDHPDPGKVANAINTLWDKGHISDKDVQELRNNRSVEDHYANLAEQQDIREELGLPLPGGRGQSQGPPPPGQPGGPEAEEEDEEDAESEEE